jgi:uncharacterized protein YjbI with pentapeptide repeats
MHSGFGFLEQLAARNKKLDAERQQEVARQTVEKLVSLLNTLNQFFTTYSLPAPDANIYASKELTDQYHTAMIEFQSLVPNVIKDLEALALGEKQDEAVQERIGNLPDSYIKQEQVMRGIATLCTLIENHLTDSSLQTREELKRNLQSIYLILMDMPAELERVLDQGESRDEKKRAHNADVIKKIEYVKAKLQTIFIGQSANHDNELADNSEVTARLERDEPVKQVEASQEASYTEENGLFATVPAEVLEHIFSFLPLDNLFTMRLISKRSDEAVSLYNILVAINQLPAPEAGNMLRRLRDSNLFGINTKVNSSSSLGVVLAALTTDDVNTLDLEKLERAIASPEVKRFGLFCESAKLILAVLKPSVDIERAFDAIRSSEYFLLQSICYEASLDKNKGEAQKKSSRNGYAPVLMKIKETGKVLLYSFSGEEWKITEVDSELFEGISFPRTDYGDDISTLERLALTEAMQQEITSKHHVRRGQQLIVNLPRVTLRGLDIYNNLDLCCVNFKGANLHEANLSQVRIDHADLSKANFSKATFDHVNMIATDLEGANLSEASLSNFTSFNSSKLNGANLSGARISHRVQFCRAHMREANLSGAYLESCSMSDADLTKINLQQATLVKVEFRSTNLEHANLSGATISDSNAYCESLARAYNLKSAILDGAKLSTCLIGFNLVGFDLSKIDLNNATLFKSNITHQYGRGKQGTVSYATFISAEQCSHPQVLSARLDELLLVQIDDSKQALAFRDAIAYNINDCLQQLKREMTNKKTLDISQLENLIACVDAAMSHPLFSSGYFQERKASFLPINYFKSKETRTKRAFLFETLREEFVRSLEFKKDPAPFIHPVFGYKLHK